MSGENLYIMLKISSYALDLFMGIFLCLFLIAVLVRVLHAKSGEYIGLFELFKEIIFAFVFTFIFIFYVNFDYLNDLILWIFISGVLLGFLQSTSVHMILAKNIYNVTGRHAFAIIWGIMVLLMELCFIFNPQYLNSVILFSILNTGILLGLNMILIAKGLRLKKIINLS